MDDIYVCIQEQYIKQVKEYTIEHKQWKRTDIFTYNCLKESKHPFYAVVRINEHSTPDLYDTVFTYYNDDDTEKCRYNEIKNGLLTVFEIVLSKV